MKTKLHFFFLFYIIFTSLLFSQTKKAKYSVVFTSVWNSTDHGILEKRSHWSKLVGATHKTEYTFWSLGEKATTGVKDIAEKGDNTIFNTEVTTAISNFEAEQYIDGNSLDTATGTITIHDLIVDKDYPLLTLLSMIAPSPDWFIGVNSVKLTDDNSNWIPLISLDLFAYDAGTDSGVGYNSSNLVTNPFQNISSLKNVDPFTDKKIGTLTISLTETLSVDEFINNSSLSIFYSKKDKSIIINNLKNQLIDLKVYSIHGKLLINKSPKNKKRLKISNLKDGLYILKIETSSGYYSKKIVKY